MTMRGLQNFNRPGIFSLAGPAKSSVLIAHPFSAILRLPNGTGQIAELKVTQ
jgi:hypothetical protein